MHAQQCASASSLLGHQHERTEHTGRQLGTNIIVWARTERCVRPTGSAKRNKTRDEKIVRWRYWGLNPGPFACKANALPLRYIPKWNCQRSNQVTLHVEWKKFEFIYPAYLCCAAFKFSSACISGKPSALSVGGAHGLRWTYSSARTALVTSLTLLAWEGNPKTLLLQLPCAASGRD